MKSIEAKLCPNGHQTHPDTGHCLDEQCEVGRFVATPVELVPKRWLDEADEQVNRLVELVEKVEVRLGLESGAISREVETYRAQRS